MPVQLEHVFAGIGHGPGEVERHASIDRLAAAIEKSPQRRLPRCGHVAQ
jgi:hypothetical protein